MSQKCATDPLTPMLSRNKEIDNNRKTVEGIAPLWRPFKEEQTKANENALTFGDKVEIGLVIGRSNAVTMNSGLLGIA